MTASVQLYPPKPAQELVRNGLAVSGRTAEDLALLANWINGRGAQMVASYSPYATIAVGSSATFRFYTKPRYQSVERVWVVTGRCMTSGRRSRFTLTTPASGAASGTYIAMAGRENLAPVMHREAIASQSSATAELSITVTVSSGSDNSAMRVEQIGCWEVPRLSLSISNSDRGVDRETCSFRQPIYDGTGKSLGALYDAINGARTEARRVAHFHYATPDDTTNAIQTTSTSYVAMFTGGPIVLARKISHSATTGSITWRVRYRTSAAGVKGNVKVTTTSGVTSTIAIPINSNAAFTWSSEATFSVDCEDLGAADGLQGATWEVLSFELQNDPTGAAGTVYVSSIDGYES